MTESDSEKGPAGPLLAGRYRAVGQLGRGGMGVVWRAVDEVLGREVAVKILRVLSDASPEELAEVRIRMRREARAAARIRHEGVITVYDVTEEDGRPVIVMELVEGPSLEDVVANHGPLDPLEAASIGARVLDALDAAHRVGVLHRDVKPGNILLGPGNRVVLTDFGIAGITAPGDGADTSLTRTGQVVGSLDYLSPERAQDLEPGPAADVWSLGMTLYTMVEGAAAPFHRSSTFATLTAIVNDPLPEPRRAGPLGPVLVAMTHKDPAHRPGAAQARDVLAALSTAAPIPLPLPPSPEPPQPSHPQPAPQRPYLPGSLSRQEAPAPPPPAARRSRRQPVLLALAAALVLAGGATAYALQAGGDGGSPAPRARPDAPASVLDTSSPSTPSLSPSHSSRPSGKPSSKAKRGKHKAASGGGTAPTHHAPAPPAHGGSTAGTSTGGTTGGTSGGKSGSVGGTSSGSSTVAGTDAGSTVGSSDGGDAGMIGGVG